MTDDNTDTDAFWAAARNTTDNLAKAASTLKNQPVALLAYLHKMYPWTRAQIGKRRECFYELSNVLSFEPALEVVMEKTYAVVSLCFVVQEHVPDWAMELEDYIFRHQTIGISKRW
jgi:hypothetical protein